MLWSLDPTPLGWWFGVWSFVSVRVVHVDCEPGPVQRVCRNNRLLCHRYRVRGPLRLRPGPARHPVRDERAHRDRRGHQHQGPEITLGTSNGFILPQAMAMAPDGDRIYVVNDLDDTISVVSTATNTVEDTWPTSWSAREPRALAVSPDGQRLYVARRDSSFIVIDVVSRSRVADLPLGLGVVRRGGVAGRVTRVRRWPPAATPWPS